MRIDRLGVVHAKYTKYTKYVIGRRLCGLDDVIAALDAGHLRHAVLDVFAPVEPLPQAERSSLSTRVCIRSSVKRLWA